MQPSSLFLVCVFALSCLGSPTPQEDRSPGRRVRVRGQEDSDRGRVVVQEDSNGRRNSTRFFTGNTAIDSAAAGAAIGLGLQTITNQIFRPQQPRPFQNIANFFNPTTTTTANPIQGLANQFLTPSQQGLANQVLNPCSGRRNRILGGNGALSNGILGFVGSAVAGQIINNVQGC